MNGKEAGLLYKQEVVDKEHIAAAAETKNGIVENGSGYKVKDAATGYEVTYSLSEVAEMVQSYPQYILSLVNREDFEFLGLKKYADSGFRETYQFTQCQVNQLKKILHLIIDKRKPPREAAFMIEHEDEYRKIAQQLSVAITAWLLTPEDKSWKALVETFSKIPTLDNKESQALVAVEGIGDSFGQCASQLSVGEREVKNILNSAKTKMGLDLLDLLRMVHEK